MKIFVRSGVLALGALLSLSACTPKDSSSEKQAPANMTQSFSAALPAECDKASCIRIQKKSLGKIFLMMVSGKTAGSTPQWYDVKPLVVSFERSGPQLALLAQNYNTIYSEIKTEHLISNFKIVTEDADSITFDWGRGLDSVIVQSPYQIDSPRGGDQALTESSYPSFPIISSYVRNIKFDDKNIELEQISKLRADKIKKSGDDVELETREESLSMNIQIRSYNLGPAFKAKEYDASRRVGFFVTKSARPQMSTETTNLITKFDIDPAKGPITVRVSASVPTEYLEAVKEGVLYWNLVFGRDVLVVKTNVDPQAGPEDRSIMIRWLPWLDAGAAYAMGQSDPLTGEVLRAQVFMPAVFTRVGSADIVSLNNNSPVFGASSNAIACDFTPSLKALNQLATEAPTSQRLRLAQDSVRSTVAHEMGHALGLRHNFAGSYSAKVTLADIQNSAKTYLKDLAHKGLETSTSIMDYVSGVDNILMAAKIKSSPLSYDKMAMDWAYAEDDKALDEKVSLYCTDEDIALAGSQAMAIYGCERFDAGRNPLQRKFVNALEDKERFVNILFASIIGRLYPADKPQVVEDLDKVIADSQKWGLLDFADDAKFMVGVLTDRTLDGQPFMMYLSPQVLKAGGILAARLGLDSDFLGARSAHLKEVGGYAAILNSLLRGKDGKIDLYWLENQLKTLVASGALFEGKTLGGRDYKLTPAEQKKIINFFAVLSAKNQKSLLQQVKALVPVIDQPTNYQGKKAVISLPIGKDLVDASAAADLSLLVLDLAEASNGQAELRVGPEAKTSVFVAKKVLSKEEITSFLPLLSNKAVGFNQDMNKAFVKKQILDGINNVLKAIDPSADFSSRPKEEQVALVAALAAQGLLDQAAQNWLNREIALYLAL